MQTAPVRLMCLVLCTSSALVRADDAADAASQYFFAILEFDQLPEYVHAATTDDPDNGFPSRLSIEQRSFVQQPAITSALRRFDHATSLGECVWNRYSGSNWSAAKLNRSLHQLARIALLRARLHYETGKWIKGNRDVERVRVMARHMSLQARFFEHQCFMVENMATATAGAYILLMPMMALDDLAERDRRVGEFAPMSRMLTAEAQRLRRTADAYEHRRISGEGLYSCIMFLDTGNPSDFVRSSRQSIVLQLRELASCIDGLSRLMDEDIEQVEDSIGQLYERYEGSRLVRGINQWGIAEYRENAQAACRGFMFRAVIDRLRMGQRDFANIDDPYSDKSLKVEQDQSGVRLVSSLTNVTEIDFRFGMAPPHNQTR